MVVMDTGLLSSLLPSLIITPFNVTIAPTSNLQDPEGRRARGGAAYNNSAVAVDREGMASIGSQYR